LQGIHIFAEVCPGDHGGDISVNSCHESISFCIV
jgi:hypothetical protein